MPINTGDAITDEDPDARFFLAPEKPLQRQYEALRAYFVERLASTEVARRFGYSAGAFRVLCHRYRHGFDPQEHFFKDVRHGPQTAPKRDRLREKVVALRKRNLSIYDIRTELAAAGELVAANTISVILREEGFARLPRRADEERVDLVRPEPAAVADVGDLDLSPRSFRTRTAGLLCFVPLMAAIDLAAFARDAALPGSRMIPAEQALRSALALKLVGTERKSHVMQMVFDEGLALFAGLNAIPKRSWFATYSSRVGQEKIGKMMALWFEQTQGAGLESSGTFDLDFHSVPANTDKEPLEKHYVSGRSRSQKAVLLFLARDATQRVLCYSSAALPKREREGEIVRFAEFYKERTGSFPAELVFDSQLTTYKRLDWLRENGIRFLTLRRRSRKMLARIFALPRSQWKRVTLRSLTRKYRTPRVLEELVEIPGYQGTLRQLTIIELGHEQPTILLTNDGKSTPAALITRYAHRMLIENGIAEAIHFFHIDALSSMVELNVDFDLQITLMGSALYRLFAARLPENYRRSHAKTLFDSLLDAGGRVEVTEHDVVVTLDHRAHNPILAQTGLLENPTPMPWFGGKNLVVRLR